MRSQREAILNAILEARGAGGGLKVDAPFLTHGDLMECVGRIVGYLGGDPERLNRNTVQAWLRAGVIRASRRSDRNRLYSALDVIRLAAVFHLTHVGFSVHAARAFADVLDEQFNVYFERWKGPDTSTELNLHDYIWGTTKEGRWNIVAPGPDGSDEVIAKQFNVSIKVSGLTVILNANLLVNFAYPVLGEKWDEKAIELRDEIDAELTKRKQGKLGQKPAEV